MTADDFRAELASLFKAAANVGRGTIVVRSGDLHRAVGGYPGTNHRMPMCCGVMYAEMVEGVDELLHVEGLLPHLGGAVPQVRHGALRGQRGQRHVDAGGDLHEALLVVPRGAD